MSEEKARKVARRDVEPQKDDVSPKYCMRPGLCRSAVTGTQGQASEWEESRLFDGDEQWPVVTERVVTDDGCGSWHWIRFTAGGRVTVGIGWVAKPAPIPEMDFDRFTRSAGPDRRRSEFCRPCK